MSNSRSVGTQGPVSACDIFKAMIQNPIKNKANLHDELIRAKSACGLGLVLSPLSQVDEMLYTYPSQFENEQASLKSDASQAQTLRHRK